MNKFEITYNDGRKYTGQLQDGFLSGEGTMIFADGTTYVSKMELQQLREKR